MRICGLLVPSDVDSLIDGIGNLLLSITLVSEILDRFDFQCYYDPEDYKSLVSILNPWEEDGYLVGEISQLRFRLRKFAGPFPAKDFGSSKYFEWRSVGGFSLPTESKILNFAIEELESESESDIVFLDLRSESNLSKFVGFKDNEHIKTLPEKFHHFPVYFNPHELEDGLKRSYDGKISLRNNAKFTKTPHIYNGASIYQEIATSDFWYRDTNHDENGQPHFEVFWSTGKKKMKKKVALDGTEIPLSSNEKERTLRI